MVDEDAVAREEVVAHQRHLTVGGGEDRLPGRRRVVGAGVGALRLAVDDAAAPEAPPLGKGVEGRVEGQGEAPLPGAPPQRGDVAALAPHPGQVLGGEVHLLAGQGERLDGIGVRAHPDGDRLAAAGPGAGELDDALALEQVHRVEAGAVEGRPRLLPPGAGLDALPGPAHHRAGGDLGHGPAPDAGSARTSGQRRRPHGAGGGLDDALHVHQEAQDDDQQEHEGGRRCPPEVPRTGTRSATITPRAIADARIPHQVRHVTAPVGAEDDGEEQDRPGGAPRRGRSPGAAQAEEHVVSRPDAISSIDLPADLEVAPVGQLGREARHQQHQHPDDREQHPAHRAQLRHVHLRGKGPAVRILFSKA